MRTALSFVRHVGKEDARLNVTTSAALLLASGGEIAVVLVDVENALIGLAHLVIDTTTASGRGRRRHIRVDWLDHVILPSRRLTILLTLGH